MLSSIRPAHPAMRPLQFAGDAKAPTIISVTGTGQVELMPDTMLINITLNAAGKDRKKVAQDLNKQSGELIEALKGLELPKTVRMQSHFNPVHKTTQWNGKIHEATGYAGSFTIQIQEKAKNHRKFPEHAAAISELVEEMKDTTFSGPYYGLSNPNKAKSKALKHAIESAKQAAQAIAEKLKLKLNATPLDVEVGSSSGQPLSGRAYSAAASSPKGGGGGSEQSFQIAPLTVPSDPVRCRFELKA